MIALRPDVDPKALQNIGIYWSLDPEAVGTYFHNSKLGDQKVNWRFSAKLNLAALHMYDTIMSRMDPEFGEAENEIVLIQHAPIYVYSAEAITGYEEHTTSLHATPDYDVDTVVKINANRRA